MDHKNAFASLPPRAQLAAAYRLCDLWGFNEGVCNHLTLEVDGAEDGGEHGDRGMLVVPHGLLWCETRASDLVRVGVAKGETHAVRAGGRRAYTDVEPSAAAIHGACHRLLGDRARAILHTHMPYATALAALQDGAAGRNRVCRLPMVHQNAALFYGMVAYDDEYNAVASSDEEGERLAKLLLEGGKRVLVLANHGVIVIGESVCVACDELYYFERACQVALLALSASARPLRPMSNDAARRVAADRDAEREKYALAHMTALVRVRLRGTNFDE